MKDTGVDSGMYGRDWIGSDSDSDWARQARQAKRQAKAGWIGIVFFAACVLYCKYLGSSFCFGWAPAGCWWCWCCLLWWCWLVPTYLLLLLLLLSCGWSGCSGGG